MAKADEPLSRSRRECHLRLRAHDGSIWRTNIQPFIAYITHTKTTFTLNSESTYDWESEQWSIPLNFVVSQLLKIGDQPIQIGAGVRYWADSTTTGPEGWGARLQVTLLFPKK